MFFVQFLGPFQKLRYDATQFEQVAKIPPLSADKRFSLLEYHGIEKTEP